MHLSLLLVAISFLLAVPPQDPTPAKPQYLLRGKVTEVGVGVPISGVAVAVIKIESGTDLGDGGFAKAFEQSILTDHNGDFKLSLPSTGDYALRFKKQSFVEPRNVVAHITATNPTTRVEVTLARHNSINGKIIDRSTQKPLKGLRIELMRVAYRAGNRYLLPTDRIGFTQPDGHFAVDQLPPGEYLIQVSPDYGHAERFTSAASTPTDTPRLGYARTYFPGGDNYADTPPLQLRDGQALSGLTIEHEPRPLRRLHVQLAGGPCPIGGAYTLMLQQNSRMVYSMRAKTTVPCNGAIELDGLLDQRYTLLALGNGPLKGLTGTVTFDVYRDADLTIDIQQSITLRGTITFEEAAQSSTPAPTIPLNLGVRSRPDDGAPIAGEGYADVAANGAFLFPAIRPLEHHFTIPGLPNHLYVKEFKYRSTTTPTGKIFIQPFPAGQQLEIVLGTRPASITAAVRHRSQPFPNAQVLLINPDLPAIERFQSMKMADHLGEGNFRLLGIPPGRYLVLAITSTLAAEINKPGILDRLLTAATSLTLAASEQHSLTLDLIEP